VVHGEPQLTDPDGNRSVLPKFDPTAAERGQLAQMPQVSELKRKMNGTFRAGSSKVA
jgi:hypothetical protein